MEEGEQGGPGTHGGRAPSRPTSSSPETGDHGGGLGLPDIQLARIVSRPRADRPDDASAEDDDQDHPTAPLLASPPSQSPPFSASRKLSSWCAASADSISRAPSSSRRRGRPHARSLKPARPPLRSRRAITMIIFSLTILLLAFYGIVESSPLTRRQSGAATTSPPWYPSREYTVWEMVLWGVC